MQSIRTLATIAILLPFSSFCSSFSTDDYDLLYERDFYDHEFDDILGPDLEDHLDAILEARFFPKGSYKTGDLTPAQQESHAKGLETLMKEDFARTRQSKLDDKTVTGEQRKHWKDAKPPMLDTVHKPGTDGKIHYGVSAGNNKNPPPHEAATNRIIKDAATKGKSAEEAKKMSYADAAKCHNSNGRCAEHAALDSFHKNNPLGSSKGANSISVGERNSDRKADKEAGKKKDTTVKDGSSREKYASPGKAQEACKGKNGKNGCEDHLKAGKINDLVHNKGTQPGDNAKKPKNKPGGKNRQPSSTKMGGTLGGSDTKKKTEQKPKTGISGSVPKKNEKNFPSLPKKGNASGGGVKTETPKKDTKAAPKKTYAEAAKSGADKKQKSTAPKKEASVPKKETPKTKPAAAAPKKETPKAQSAVNKSTPAASKPPAAAPKPVAAAAKPKEQPKASTSSSSSSNSKKKGKRGLVRRARDLRLAEDEY